MFPRLKKWGGHVPRVPRQIAPMLSSVYEQRLFFIVSHPVFAVNKKIQIQEKWKSGSSRSAVSNIGYRTMSQNALGVHDDLGAIPKCDRQAGKRVN